MLSAMDDYPLRGLTHRARLRGGVEREHGTVGAGVSRIESGDGVRLAVPDGGVFVSIQSFGQHAIADFTMPDRHVHDGPI